MNIEHNTLIDTFNRSINYLRVSITDHCNLRCQYCTPRDGKTEHANLLSYEEILRVVRLAVGLGIKKVRLTGGEPLVRRGVMPFIQRLAQVDGLREIRLTTNGVLLEDMLPDLHEAGLEKLNISLDSLRPRRFEEITGSACFAKVWRGIEKALEMGFPVIKLNVVAMRGVNDDEFIDFARLSIKQPLDIRFIEFMPVGLAGAGQQGKFISAADIMTIIAPLGELQPIKSQRLHGPARMFKLPGAAGSLGFISPLSNHFCDTCNRLRLTSQGRLRSCLLTDREEDIKGPLRAGASDDDIRQLLIKTIINKPKGHTLAQGRKTGSCHGEMSRIGG
ncbi:MAG TPA: GTP 3',8-cyclase MoaA [Desulfobacterales bacterium]|nr:GTP 3',8-cyclase MoaA [Desulfobacterales bacterium]